MKTSSHTQPSIVTETATFIGIDYHKKYSVWHAVDAAGSDLGKGRIEHHSPHDFATLVKRWPNARVVFEASMNWHWLYEVLEQSMVLEHLTQANPFKTRKNGMDRRHRLQWVRCPWPCPHNGKRGQCATG